MKLLSGSSSIYSDPSQLNPFRRTILKLLAQLYRFVTMLRNKGYDSGFFKTKKLPGYTISVGNIVVGGTGKSPFVIALAKILLKNGFQPAIVTRGHGSHLSKDESMCLLNGDVVMEPERSSKATLDEPMMQSHELKGVPVVVGARRFEAVKRYLHHSGQNKVNVTHWLLDDGFQHRKLQRDYDIVLLDSQLPFGNGHPLPLGSLRESVKGLKRGQKIVFTRSDENAPSKGIVDYVKRLGVPTVSFAPQRVEPPLLVQGKAIKSIEDPELKVAIASAIARPHRFVESLESFGVSVKEKYFLPDHWSFDEEKIRELSRAHDALVTTAKDYWRDPSVFEGVEVPVYILPIYFDIDPETFSDLLKKA